MGLAISSGTLSTQQGRGRAMRFFRATFPTRTPTASPPSRRTPYLRYFFVQRRQPAASSQMAPPLPRAVIFGIRKSRNGPVRAAWIPCKTV